MSEKSDAELYIAKLDTLLKASLNTKITEINAIKNDGITLKQLDNNAYYYLTFGQKTPAYDPAIVFGIDTEVNGSIGGLSDETLRVTVELIVSSGAIADSLELMKILQRYRRALMEVLMENYRKFPAISIVGLPDIPFTVDKDSGLFYAIGVGVEMKYTID